MSSDTHKCARFAQVLSFEGLCTKMEVDSHKKATKDAFAEARKMYPQANKFRRRSLAEEKQLIRSFQASRRAVASLRQIEEATKVRNVIAVKSIWWSNKYWKPRHCGYRSLAKRSVGEERSGNSGQNWWIQLLKIPYWKAQQLFVAVLCSKPLSVWPGAWLATFSYMICASSCRCVPVLFVQSDDHPSALTNAFVDIPQLPRWVLLVFLEIQAEMWRVQQQPVVQNRFRDLLNECNRQCDLKRVQEQLLLAGVSIVANSNHLAPVPPLPSCTMNTPKLMSFFLLLYCFLCCQIPQWILVVECNARATHYDISKGSTLKLIDYLLEWDPASFDISTMFELCQVCIYTYVWSKADYQPPVLS